MNPILKSTDEPNAMNKRKNYVAYIVYESVMERIGESTDRLIQLPLWKVNPHSPPFSSPPLQRQPRI
jgi:hypothetical protein